MRPLSVFALLLPLCACVPQEPTRPPPTDRFYSPSGVAFVADGSPDGVLYVTNANFDRRWASGSMIEVPLSALGLPAIGATPPSAAPKLITDLQLDPARQVGIESFPGELVPWRLPDGTLRLITPTRAEHNYLYLIDVTPDAIVAHPYSLTANETVKGDSSKYRAPQPLGVGVAPDGQAFVTHGRGADFPVGSGRNVTAFLFSFDANVPAEDFDVRDPAHFKELGIGATNSVAVGQRYTYLSGRYISPQAYLIRMTERAPDALTIFNPLIEDSYRLLEARAVVIRADESRLYLLGHGPDTLMIADIHDPGSDLPTVGLVKALPLPPGSNQIKLIERPGRAPLAVIAATNTVVNGSLRDGTVVVYDDEVGQIVAQAPSLGIQTYGLTIDQRANSARIFATNYGDGRVAVIDMPDLNRPQDIRTVAYLGASQLCLPEFTPDDPYYCAAGATP